ncbi:MAG TPA: amidohydrolase [Anaerolineae bacterium]|nr:amidohydrolase [Anaerolineae bacterium]
MPSSLTLDTIAAQSEALRARLSGVRRAFAMMPELSGEEAQTAQTVAAHLRDLGLRVTEGVGGYGVVGLLEGGKPGPIVAYRADMDALPIPDALETPYRSLALGIKHACGHDAHMTIALGAAEVLAGLRADLCGTVKFIFQPAEESLDGAQAMLADGVLDDPTPEAIFALHVFTLPVGVVGVAEDLALAGMDEFRVRFYSPAGDLAGLIARAAAALEALSVAREPEDAAGFAELVDAMQANDALRQTVFLSCWPLPANPLRHHLLGLVSIPDPALRSNVQDAIRVTLTAVTDEVGGTYDLAYTFYNPPTRNDAKLVHLIKPWLAEVVEESHVLTFRAPYPFAHEDFALYQERIPGVFIWLGIANPEQGIPGVLHRPDFDIDEEALVIGTRLAATLLAQWSESITYPTPAPDTATPPPDDASESSPSPLNPQSSVTL